MGILTKLFGGADGIREVMRESYAKHVLLARRRATEASELHAVGLYGALASRYRSSSRNAAESAIWAELIPFLEMPERESVELLAEYVVLQEMPQQTRAQDLSDGINRVFESGLNEEHAAMAAVAFANRAPWCSLLRSEAAALLRAGSNQPSAADDDQGSQDDAEAATWDSEWNSKAADENAAAARNNLGVMYENGQSVPQDDAQAVAWYRKAADEGHAQAQHRLGLKYRWGLGVPEDHAQAVAWVRLAADQGDAGA